MPAPVVHIDQLSIAFDGHQVLRDFTFTLIPGQTIAVVGESGSGKSVAALMAMDCWINVQKLKLLQLSFLAKTFFLFLAKSGLTFAVMRWLWFFKTP